MLPKHYDRVNGCSLSSAGSAVAKQALVESMFLIGCARGSCARGCNVCDMHAQIMQQSTVVRKQQQHVEFALRDKHVVTLTNCLQTMQTRRVHQVECDRMRMLQICVACVHAYMMAHSGWQCHS